MVDYSFACWVRIVFAVRRKPGGSVAGRRGFLSRPSEGIPFTEGHFALAPGRSP
jgi:hypothetical protein